MKIKTLLLGTSLSLIPQFVNAQCVATTDCATLGYTETSCPNGKGIKCPFGNTWACPSTEDEICAKYGFKYDCSGTGYVSGSGTPCNNKYTSCTCASGYEWKDGKCEKIPEPEGAVLGQCTGYAKNCKIADILYSDGSCSADVVSGKIPIAVVVYIGGDGCGTAVGLEELENKAWSTKLDDISQVELSGKIEDDVYSCEHTRAVLDYSSEKYGDYAAEYYPVFWQIYNYAPQGAGNTQGKWCLPAEGMWYKIFDNLEAVNSSLKKLNKDIIAESVWWWSSTQQDISDALAFDIVSGHFPPSKDEVMDVRPVIEF